jgi:pyruvate dehydrogenase E1 component beta subunit
MSENKTYSISVRDALRHAMYEEMMRDENVFVMGEEVAEYRGAYKVTGDLFEIFNKNGKNRIIDTPITEHGFAGIGVGAAFAGLRPIVEFMTFNFALQAIDQIINSAAKTRYMSGGQVSCPIVFRGPNGVAAGVAAQHSQSFGSMYAHIPGLKVVAPYFAEDCRGLLKAAIRDDNPVIFLEHELVYGESHPVSKNYLNRDYYKYLNQENGEDIDRSVENFEQDFLDANHDLFKIGKARIVKEGADVTIITYSRMVGFAIEAEKILSEKGINVEILDLRSLRPLDDEAIINSVKKTNLVVVADEEWPQYSVSSEIIALINDKAFDYLDGPVVRVNAKDVPLPYASNLEQLAVPGAQEIVDAVVDLIERRI